MIVPCTHSQVWRMHYWLPCLQCLGSIHRSIQHWSTSFLGRPVTYRSVRGESEYSGTLLVLSVTVSVFRYIYCAQYHGGECDRETGARRGLPQIKWDQCHWRGGHRQPRLLQGTGGCCYYGPGRTYSGLTTKSHLTVEISPRIKYIYSNGLFRWYWVWLGLDSWAHTCPSPWWGLTPQPLQPMLWWHSWSTCLEFHRRGSAVLWLWFMWVQSRLLFFLGGNY